MRIGVDFGGTKIEVAALDEEGRFLARRRSPNPGNYEEAIKVIASLVNRVEVELGRKGTVGIGAPGSISLKSQAMRNANSVWLNGRRLREDISVALEREIRLANDANCLALSEATDGAAKGADVAFAIILGTGCGGGVTVGGRLIEGANGIGGEWGHTPLPWTGADETPGPDCWCGKQGCLETWISGKGVARDHEMATGEKLTAQQVIHAAHAGEPAAAETLERFIHRLSRSIAVVCNILDPEVVVLGGGLSNIPEIYERAPSIVADYVFSDNWRTNLAPAKWGDSSGVRGAARLWPSPAEQSVRRKAMAKAPQ